MQLLIQRPCLADIYPVMKNAILLLTCCASLSCTKEKDCCVMPYQIYYLKATVLQTSDISCHSPVLGFSDDSERIRMQTKIIDLSFNVSSLPEQYRIQGQKLYVLVESPKPPEIYICNMLGIPLPQLKVTKIEPRE